MTLLAAVLAMAAACGAKKEDDDQANNPNLVQAGALGDWKGSYSKGGYSLDTGQLIDPVSVELFLYKDSTFQFNFEGDKAKIVQGTFLKFEKEIRFTIAKSTYPDFATAPAEMVGQYEIADDDTMKLQFGSKRVYYLNRGSKSVAAPAGDEGSADSDSKVQSWLCQANRGPTAAISVNLNDATFSCSIYSPDATAPSRYRGRLEESSNADRQTLTVLTRLNDSFGLQSIELIVADDGNSAAMTAIDSDGDSFASDCQAQ